MSLSLRAAAATDLGLVRHNNEDASFAGRCLVAVADGIGGMPAGELASEAVMRALVALEDGLGGRSPLPALREAVEAANEEIGEAGRADPVRDGMGTTVTALLLAGSISGGDGTGAELALLHVGDSRGYLFRGGELCRLTKDDTFVQELVDQGVLTVDEVRHHPLRSVITRAVQGRPLEPSLAALTARLGDRYLLCSDGLSDVVDDAALARTLAAQPAASDCVRELIQQALDAGGPDNITVVVADVVEEG
ncbi:MAG TPA: protein phosphatase 2C domain-containing protein [Rugosimonospora sp.]|nr:protein phosphatase 2C domain-containing protein [Rugosimonospora sp.]